MSDLKDLHKRIEGLKEPQGPAIPGHEISMPPREPIQPIEDEGQQSDRIFPKDPAGY